MSNKIVCCPVCGGSANTVRRISKNELLEGYRGYYEDEVTDNLVNVDSYEMKCCSKCKLIFATPFVSGSEEYYSWVTQHKDYYAYHRWEWEKIVEYIEETINEEKISILEIGCGDGVFLEYIQEKLGNKVKPYGVDMTYESIEICRKKGLHVECCSAEEYLSNNPDKQFDIVCSFHCLEHVIDPKHYVESMVNVCKKNGLVVNSFPYSGHVFENWFDVLNLPPHHMTRWNESAIKELGNQVNCNVHLLTNEFPPIGVNMKYTLLYRFFTKRNAILVGRKKFYLKCLCHFPIVLKELWDNLFRDKVEVYDKINSCNIKKRKMGYHVMAVFYVK